MSELHDPKFILSELDEASPSGYAIALHIEYSAPRILYQTYDQEWTGIYADKGYVLDDPTVHWAFGNLGMERLSVIAKNDPKNIFTQAADFGLVYGFTVSLERNATHTMASFARLDREFTNDEMKSIEGLLEQLHDESATVTTLSHADLNALHQISIGKTQAEAAKDLDISLTEIRARLTSARKNLGVEKTHDAVQKALAERMIEI